ncbi:MAG: polysaccharide biosynthesis tyrosine autokinase [Acidimicrobiia bacterium]|nr:polysaccharide biosynthesis tyrosine autokinase [Acidimicrobiia bacterium]MDH5237717.1 polysaccharide biosynthesis tyrosine autokinase [Acidimicrobiia bacterium]
MDNDHSLRDYLSVLRRRWWLVALATLVVAGAALGYSLAATPMYQATATVLLDSQQSTGGILDEQTGVGINDARAVQTEVAFIESLAVEIEASDRLGVEATISAEAASDANVIDFVATSSDADRAALIANTYASTYIDLRRQSAVNELEASAGVIQARISQIDDELDRLGPASTDRPALEANRELYVTALERLQVSADLFGAVQPRVISQAEVPESPFTPQVARNAVLGVVVGLILGVGLALLRETLDTSVRNKASLERITDGLPTLALIPAAQKGSVDVLSRNDILPEHSEAYRTLRTSLQFLALENELKVVQVTSPQPGDGKSTTAANLAIAYARTGKLVVIVDFDLRKPRIHKLFSLRAFPGVTDVLVTQLDPVDSCRRPFHDLSLHVIPAGHPAPNPSEVLGSSAARRLLDALREAADIIIVDTPPVLPVTDPLVVAGMVDATILVCDAKNSDTRDVSRALEMLRQVHAPVVGTVLNRAARDRRRGYGYGYGDPVADTEDYLPGTNGDSDGSMRKADRPSDAEVV